MKLRREQETKDQLNKSQFDQSIMEFQSILHQKVFFNLFYSFFSIKLIFNLNRIRRLMN